jgi:hypothetical protein
MTIQEVELPIENLKKKYREEIQSVIKVMGQVDETDVTWHYYQGKLDGLRLASYFLPNQEEEKK